jgi:hypothetical protein
VLNRAGELYQADRRTSRVKRTISETIVDIHRADESCSGGFVCGDYGRVLYCSGHSFLILD